MQVVAVPGHPDFSFPSVSAWAAQALRAAGRPWRLEADGQAAEAGEAPSSLVFVERGRLALIWLDASGRSVEVGAIEPGGVLGLAEAISGGRYAFDVQADRPVEGWSVPVSVALKAIEADPSAMAAVWRHAMAELNAARRGVGCVLRHGTEARLADWLLRLQGQAPGARVIATHEGLSQTLGLNRTTVTELISRFAAAGWVRAGRGWLEVADGRALGRVACGCRNVGHRTDAGAGSPQAGAFFNPKEPRE